VMNSELSESCCVVSMRGLVVVKQYFPVRRQHNFAFAEKFNLAFITTVLMSSFVIQLNGVCLRVHALPCLRSRPSSIRTRSY
jgi:hypothetical protein